MCDFCVSATVGEAEAYYCGVRKGTIVQLFQHTLTAATPRHDLVFRQQQEIDLGLFDDAPKFKRALQRLINQTQRFFLRGFFSRILGYFLGFFLRRVLTPLEFEKELVALRKRFGRPVYSTQQVQQMIAAAQQRCGRTPPVPTTAEAGYLAVAQALAQPVSASASASARRVETVSAA